MTTPRPDLEAPPAATRPGWPQLVVLVAVVLVSRAGIVAVVTRLQGLPATIVPEPAGAPLAVTQYRPA